ncbi:MAG: SLBB domain-containing protein [Planctomycetota bacterium]
MFRNPDESQLLQEMRRRTCAPCRLRRVGALACVVAVSVFAAGCSGLGSAEWFKNGLLDPTQVGNFTSSVSNEIRESITILEEPTGIQGAEDPSPEDLVPLYTELAIGPGDVLNVTMYEVMQAGGATTVQVRVGNTGFETLPVIGPVKMMGLTPRELELEVKARLRDANILEDADIQVSRVASPSMQYSVVGSITRPGQYPLQRLDTRLLDVVAAAGGISPLIESIYIFRLTEAAGLPGGTMPVETFEFDRGATFEEPVSFMMSEVSTGRAGTRDGPPASGPEEPKQGSAIDELDILDGGPAGSAPAPGWDADRGVWVLSEDVRSDVSAATRATSGVATQSVEAPVGEPASSASSTSISMDESDRALSPSRSGIPDDESGQAEPIEEELPEIGAELSPPMRIIEIPVKGLLEGDPRYNVVVRPSDTINVPPGAVGEFYLGGNVARPGAYALTGRRLTVKQAIISAGGFSALAWPSKAELIRRLSKDEEHTIQLDLDAIFAGKAPDFYLKPNDIVNVGTHQVAVFMAVLRNAFRFSYGFGLVYDRNFGDSDSFGAREQVKNRHRVEAQAKGIPF